MPIELHLFSVEEANGLIAEISPELRRLSGDKREFDRLQNRIEVLGLAVSGAAPGNPDAEERRQLVDLRDGLAARLSQGVGRIQRHGCLVKDLERGLVDFYALSGDRLVFLCWQLGEAEVGHWHTLEGGYARRQPLDRSELE
jgi:hypothetical protein